MLRPGEIFGLAALLAASLTLSVPDSRAQVVPSAPHATAAVASPQPQKAKAHAGKKQALVAEVAQTPPAPPTLEEQPPSPPRVSYKNGELSIDSRNATLSQVLRSVQTQTGASVDMPPGAGSERVVASLGPGKPKDVLASLLDGSKFNYVILGEANNPGGVQKVILMAKSGPATNTAGMNTAQNGNFRSPPPPQPVEQQDDEYQQNEPEAENQNQVVPGQSGVPGSEQVNPDSVNPAGRTPEQMLQELQRMQQQQQQMQQQLNPANQGSQPQPLGVTQPPGVRPQD